MEPKGEGNFREVGPAAPIAKCCWCDAACGLNSGTKYREHVVFEKAILTEQLNFRVKQWY